MAIYISYVPMVWTDGWMDGWKTDYWVFVSRFLCNGFFFQVLGVMIVCFIFGGFLVSAFSTNGCLEGMFALTRIILRCLGEN